MAIFKFNNVSLDDLVDKISKTTQLFYDNTATFCEQTLNDNIGHENVIQLRKLGKDLYKALSEFEKVLKLEYSKQIKDTFEDGKETTRLLCNGIKELISATTCMKSALDKAMGFLENNYSNADKKRVKKEIYADLKQASKHIVRGVKDLYNGMALMKKTVSKIQDLSNKISLLFTAFDSATSVFAKNEHKEHKSKHKAKKDM